MNKIAFGGGCHWCTEAVFQSLNGVEEVNQGFVASTNQNSSFSEAVIVHFNDKTIPLEVLIQIHLLTHKSTSNHSMRSKYRSAIYYFSESQHQNISAILESIQFDFDAKIITKVIPFNHFKPSEIQFQNYFKNNPNKPFCTTYIHPKLKLLQEKFGKYLTDDNSLKAIK